MLQSFSTQLSFLRVNNHREKYLFLHNAKTIILFNAAQPQKWQTKKERSIRNNNSRVAKALQGKTYDVNSLRVASMNNL